MRGPLGHRQDDRQRGRNALLSGGRRSLSSEDPANLCGDELCEARKIDLSQFRRLRMTSLRHVSRLEELGEALLAPPAKDCLLYIKGGTKRRDT